MSVPGVYVIDGLDIERYPDAAAAASAVEGYDAHSFRYYASDGTVLTARVLGPEWGPVVLEASPERRLPELMSGLQALAEYLAVTDTDEIADADALYAAIEHELLLRRSARGRSRPRAT